MASWHLNLHERGLRLYTPGALHTDRIALRAEIDEHLIYEIMNSKNLITQIASTTEVRVNPSTS